MAAEVKRSHDEVREEKGRGSRVERMVGWKRPSGGWIKLSTDGASHGNSGPATACGIFTGWRWTVARQFCSTNRNMFSPDGRAVGSVLQAPHCLG